MRSRYNSVNAIFLFMDISKINNVIWRVLCVEYGIRKKGILGILFKSSKRFIVWMQD
jgi:hypothetical protein